MQVARPSVHGAVARLVQEHEARRKARETDEGVLLALTIAVLVAGSALAQPAGDPFLIMPGVGIGPVTVGMTVTDAVRIFGTPKPATTKLVSIVLPIPDGSLAFWWDPSPEVRQQGGGVNDGFEVITDKAGTVYEVQGPFDNRFHTAEGLRVGSKASDVTGAFGTPSREPTSKSGRTRFYVYDQRGIAWLIQNDHSLYNFGLVNGIWVFTPRAAP
jgi:hypothetical protein